MSFAEGVEEDSSLSPLSITGLPVRSVSRYGFMSS
jgi:hypothetical protein